MNEFDDDESKTPERATPVPKVITDQSSGLTDSQREWFRDRFESGTPVVRGAGLPQVPVPYPMQLVARTTTPDELRLLRQNRLAGDQAALAEYVVKMHSGLIDLAKAFNARVEQDSSDNQQALEELRTLLSKPPNGRVKVLAEHVGRLELEMARRFDALERKLLVEAGTEQVQDLKDDMRLKSLEGDARFAKRTAQTVIVFLILSLGAAGLWIGIREQRLETVIETLKDHDRKLDRLIVRQKDIP